MSSPALCDSPPCTPASESPPSTTPSEAEGPAFFGLPVLWGSSGGSVKGRWVDQGEKDTQRHWNSTGGLGPGSKVGWSEPARGTKPEVALREGGTSSAHIERGSLQGAGQEENFFQVLRRKLFEGDSQSVPISGAGDSEMVGSGDASKGGSGQEPHKVTEAGSEIEGATLKFSPAFASGKGSNAPLSSPDLGPKKSGPKKTPPREGVKSTPQRIRSAKPVSTPKPKAQSPPDAVAEEAAAKFGLVRMVFGES